MISWYQAAGGIYVTALLSAITGLPVQGGICQHGHFHLGLIVLEDDDE